MSGTVSATLHMAGAWDVYPQGGFKQTFRKAFKQALFFCYLYCGWIWVRDLVLGLIGRSHVVILYYHRVGWVDVLSKPSGAFRADMQYVGRNYQCLTLRELTELLQSGAPIRRKIAVVTFDDGYRDNYLAAFPELKRSGLRATFFVTTGFIGTQKVFPHDARALSNGTAAREDWAKMTWDELREMQKAGMEIGSHTVDHANMGQLDEQTVRGQAAESLGTLQRELGHQARSFCFPWGKRQDRGGSAPQILREVGYYAAVTTEAGTVRRDDDLFQLRRIDLGNGHFTRLASFAAIEGLGCGWLARYLRR